MRLLVGLQRPHALNQWISPECSTVTDARTSLSIVRLVGITSLLFIWHLLPETRTWLQAAAYTSLPLCMHPIALNLSDLWQLSCAHTAITNHTAFSSPCSHGPTYQTQGQETQEDCKPENSQISPAPIRVLTRSPQERDGVSSQSPSSIKSYGNNDDLLQIT